MAPIRIHQYQPRSTTGGQKFTILFGAIAGLLVLGCFVWGFLIPLIRKKYFLPKPSQTKYNQYLQPNSSIIPLIPVVSSSRKQVSTLTRVSTPVTMYNPRFQTPFPRAPTYSESILPSQYASPKLRSPVADASHSLFTPTRSRRSSSVEARSSKPHTLPRLRSRSEVVRSVVQDNDFSDAKEYILAIPEPLRLRSRTYGCQLPPPSTLGTLPGSITMSKSTDKHLHPNKLFARLSEKDLRDSSCSSSSLKIQKSEQVQEDDSSSIYQQDDAMPRLSEQSTDPEAQKQELEQVPIKTTSLTPTLDIKASESSAHNASVAALHRLHTYRSLVGAPPPQPLSRAGTLTRPKTPVAKMRNMYDKGANKGEPTIRAVDRNDTMSTLLRDVADSSDLQSPRSSATSPQKVSPQNFAASSLSLLPTPLCINRMTEDHTNSPPTRHDSRIKEELGSTDAVSSPYKGSHNIIQEEDPHIAKIDFALPTTVGRPRPTPLKLIGNPHRILHQKSPIPVLSSPTRKERHFCRPEILSFQASSIYSRDTQGLSIARTPGTPDFPGTLSFRLPFSPFLPSTIGGTTDSDKGTEVNLIKEKGTPADVANYKVDNWDVDTSDIQLNTSPSSSLKRALSDLGPDCKSSHDVSSGEEADRYSAISTEMAPSEARLSSVVGPVRISDCTFVATPRKSDRAVLDGTDWL